MDSTQDYISRDGTRLLVYNLNAGGAKPIHGAYRRGNEWYLCAWTVKGTFYEDAKHNLDIDWERSDEVA